MKQLLFVCVTLLLVIASYLQGSHDNNISMIKKSTLDSNQYRGMMLQNGLEVILVQLPQDSKQAALAMSVGIGSNFDPQDYQGMSHLLEHSMFLGTKNYPKNNGFISFVQKNGGSYNAYTSSELVNYFFSVDKRALPEAMARFADMFSSPLFTRASIDKERNIVESEYRMYLNEDSRRFYDLLRELTPKDHPAHKFSVGNALTLDDSPMPIEQAIHEFFQRYYHAGNMKLVVSAPEPLDSLEDKVRTAFSGVAVAHEKDKLPKSQLRKAQQLPRLVYWQPLSKKQHKMHILFLTPRYKEYKGAKPWLYIGNLLGDEGDGSLLQLLQQKGLATGLQAGSFARSETEQLFGINIELTEKGRREWRKITGMSLQLVKKLLHEQPVFFELLDEQARLMELQFTTRESLKAIKLTTEIARNMQIYPINEVLTLPYLMKPDAEKVAEAITNMVPSNMEILLTTEDPVKDKTKWFSVPYEIEGLDLATLSAWQREAAQETSELAMPQANDFVPNVDVTALKLDDVKNIDIPDAKFVTPGNGIVQIKQPQQDRLRGVARIIFELDKKDLSLRDKVGLKLLVALAQRQMTPVFYPAYLAGLHLNMEARKNGLLLSINGYRQKQPYALGLWKKAFAELDINRKILQEVRVEMLRDMQASLQVAPFRLMGIWLNALLVEGGSTPDEQIAAIQEIDLASVRKLHARILSPRTKALAIMYGNYSFNAYKFFQEELTSWSPASYYNRLSAVKKPEQRAIYTLTKVPASETEAILWYAQGSGQDIKEKAAFILLAHMMHQPFFTSVRTEQQIGYVVFANYAELEGVPGLGLTVQSDVASTEEMIAITSSFLESFVLSDDLLAAHKASVRLLITERKKSTLAQFALYEREIMRNNLTFDYRKRLLAAVDNVNLQDISKLLPIVRESAFIIRTDDGDAPNNFVNF